MKQKETNWLSATHAANLPGKIRNSSNEDIGRQWQGEYLLEFERSEELLEFGSYSMEVSGYGSLTNTPIKVMRDKNFNKLHNNFLSDKVIKFLEKEALIRSLGVEVVKRSFLLHGSPGSGKTHEINNTVKELIGDKGISFSIAMSRIDIGSFVSFLEHYDPPQGTDKCIITIEDLGGGETPDMGFKTMGSQDDLLAFLDGNSIPAKWRKVPIVLFSTTNYPTLFLANLVDRPGRFDEVIEVKYPSGDLLVEYAEDFMGTTLPDMAKNEIAKGELSIAHVKDACIRFLVYDEAIHITIQNMRKWTEKIRQSFEKKER